MDRPLALTIFAMIVLSSACGRNSDKPADKAPGTPQASSGDQERLQGTWEVVAAENAGKREEAPAELRGKWTWTFKGDKVYVVDAEGPYEATWTMDQAQSPKTFDMTTTSGTDKGTTVLGLYELDGDRLKLCFAANRPELLKRPGEIRSDATYSVAHFKRSTVFLPSR
jgi:uncharacterized protein (TIGR03067 family)